MSIIIRQATLEDAAGITKVHIDTWRTTYRGIVPDEFLANMSYEERTQRWTNIFNNSEGKSYHFVAENDDGCIVGFVSGGVNRDEHPRYQSELYAIYILEAYHGQGIGKRLTVALVERLLQMGLDSMILWVIAVNPARRFYEALGGQLVGTQQFEIAGASIDEVAYGWPDIRTLLKGNGS
jgi:ribosomal protein S18 acetylase RimI-like enzyme